MSSKPPKGNNKNKFYDSNGSFESAYELSSLNKDKIKRFMAAQMQFFNENYDFYHDILDEDQVVEMPSELDIFEYCKYVTTSSKMENEIPIISLVYIERLLLKTGLLLNKYNWRRLALITLCLGSKIWDDDSLEN